MARNPDPRYRKLRSDYINHYFYFKNMIGRARKLGVECGFDFNYDSLCIFIEYIGPIPQDMVKPTVGRFDHNKGYIIGNFRWQPESENKSEGTKSSNASQLQKGTHAFSKGNRSFQEGLGGKAQLAAGTHNFQINHPSKQGKGGMFSQYKCLDHNKIMSAANIGKYHKNCRIQKV